MKRVSLLVLCTALCGCGTIVRLSAVVPPPPPPVVAVAVAPPVAVAVAAPAPAVDVTVTPAAPADSQGAAEVNVEVAPEVASGEPEEVTATTEPPDLVYEEQTDSPGEGYVWVGGYWGWTGTDWGWYGGRWLVAPEGQIYIAPYYERVGGSVVFVNGYWGGHDEAPRSYGGDRIVFAAAVRPPDYRRGEHRAFERRAGARPGSRPATAYAHATGAPRPMPHATAPRRLASNRAAQPGRGEAAKTQAGPRGAPAARPASKAPAFHPIAPPAKKK